MELFVIVKKITTFVLGVAILYKIDVSTQVLPSTLVASSVERLKFMSCLR